MSDCPPINAVIARPTLNIPHLRTYTTYIGTTHSMNAFAIFLETSTIHGLKYIATTKKYVRLFWILVICSGFSGAGYLIYQSFHAWEESPVKTTIETRPIADITFPKATVCAIVDFTIAGVHCIYFLQQHRKEIILRQSRPVVKRNSVQPL